MRSLFEWNETEWHKLLFIFFLCVEIGYCNCWWRECVCVFSCYKYINTPKVWEWEVICAMRYIHNLTSESNSDTDISASISPSHNGISKINTCFSLSSAPNGQRLNDATTNEKKNKYIERESISQKIYTWIELSVLLLLLAIVAYLQHVAIWIFYLFHHTKPLQPAKREK